MKNQNGVFLVRLGMSSFHSPAVHALCSEEWQPGRAAPSSCAWTRPALGQRGIPPVAAHNSGQWLPHRGVVISPGGTCVSDSPGLLPAEIYTCRRQNFPLLAGATCVCPGDNKCWCSLLLRDCVAACAGSQILIHLSVVSIYCNPEFFSTGTCLI